MRFNRMLVTAISCLPFMAHAMSDLEEMKSKVDAVAIWQGFEFSWQDAPHRAGRFGNWIQQERIDNQVNISLNQSAASGASADTGQYRSHYALLASPNLRSIPGSEQFTIEGPQLVGTAPAGGLTPADVNLHEFSRTVNISFESIATAEINATVLLGGFDLQRNVTDEAIPQKLSILDINISEPIITSSSSLQFVISGAVRMSCRSGECNRSEDVDYTLTVPYVVLHGPQETFYSEQLTRIQRTATHHVTSSPTVLENINTPINLQNPTAAQDLANLTTGISSIRLEATKPTDFVSPDPTPHLKIWEMYLKQDGNSVIGNHYFNDAATISNTAHMVNMEVTTRPVALYTDFAWISQCVWTDETDFAAELGNQSGGITHASSTGRVEPLYYLLNGKTWEGEVHTPILGGQLTVITQATECLENESRIQQ